MEGSERAEPCDFCGKGPVVERTEEIALHQWTDKGYVFCRVAIPLAICRNCGGRNWHEKADAIIAEAVRHAYDKLP
jgi:hypothetical protein